MGEKQSRDFTPYFVVGAPRSGTTLLATILDRHPLICVPPETHFFEHAQQLKHYDYTSHQLLEKKFFEYRRLLDLNLRKDEFSLRFREYAPVHSNLFRAAMEMYSNQLDKPLVVEKTPGHLAYVHQLMTLYPKTKFICVIRDGRDVTLSRMRMPWSRDMGLVLNSLNWNMYARLAFQFDSTYDNFLTIRFEDLITSPEKSTKRIDAFLGVPFSKSQLDPSVKSSTVPSWETNWKAKSLEVPDRSRAFAWKQSATLQEKQQMTELMKKYLGKFGYCDSEICTPLHSRCMMGLIRSIAESLTLLPGCNTFPQQIWRLLRKFNLTSYQ